jgi:hypothetical protein
MNHEAETGPAQAPDGGGRHRGGPGDGSPFQTRAAFLQVWDWQSVIRINRGACERGSAQHGLGPETGPACAASWEQDQHQETSLIEALDLLRAYHRRAPFLFFNGNSFAAIARQLAEALFRNLPVVRRREVISAFAHYVAGVLDRDSMVSAVVSLCAVAALAPGDRVQTLRGTTRGTIVRILDDGRVVWKPEGTDTEMTGLPEGLRLVE